MQEVVLSKQVTHYDQVRLLYYNLKIPHREASSLSATWGRAEQLCGFNPWKPLAVPSIVVGKTTTK